MKKVYGIFSMTDIFSATNCMRLDSLHHYKINPKKSLPSLKQYKNEFKTEVEARRFLDYYQQNNKIIAKEIGKFIILPYYIVN